MNTDFYGTSIFAVILAYLLGSISFAVLVSRGMGLKDPRTYGSGNPGATNVLRSGNKLAAILTLLGDALKGWLAVYLVQRFAQEYYFGPGTIAAVAVAVFAGHLYPVFHQFVGGKGVATAAGVLLALDWRIGLGTIAAWIFIAYFFRYSSLAAIVSALVAVFVSLVLLGDEKPLVVAVIVIAALLVYRHKDNIGRLIAGKESKLGSAKK
jgi:acyl phosphate:glycerol-3-phosphate acyltransferase